MKVLFIAGCYSAESIESLRSKCRGDVGIQNAPNAFQWSVIKGLKENGVDFEVISFPKLPVFPMRYKRPFTPQSEILYNDEKVGSMFSYCTIVGIKPISIRNRLYRVVKRKLEDSDADEAIWLLLYTIDSFMTSALIALANQYPNVRIAAIITDLIDDAFNYKSNNTFLKRIQIKGEIKAQKNSYRFIDKFILLTKAMEERIPEAIGSSIVVEGICDRDLSEDIPLKSNNSIKTILYTGTLQKYVGIDDFVDAFTLTDNPNYRLVICGVGPSDTYISAIAKEDIRIVYKGMVSREIALTLQQKATLVVNPRKPTESITRFSFPSKTIEYLSSGTPMIGYRLEGIPEDYYPYFYTPSDLTKESMASLLDEVLSKTDDELYDQAKSARRFISEEKNAKRQVAKIIDFLKLL